MQRWMLWAVLGVVGLALLAGGGLYGYREYLRGKPDKIWVPLALRADLSMADQNKLAEEIEKRLNTDEILRQVVIDVDLRKKLKSPSEAAAMEELKRRIFVTVGTADSPAGTVPAINIGVNGTGREKELLGEMATRIVKDVWRMIGVDPETGKAIEQPPLAPSDGFAPDVPEF